LDTLSGKENFPHLRLIELQGEPILKRDVKRYQNYFSPQCILVNKLGAREIGGSIRCYFIDKSTEIQGAAVPAGYAVEDKHVRLLDDAGREVGFGQTGEITVESRYLALGYWRKPDLTRAKFVPSLSRGDGRLYFTGDIGRKSPDGCLEWIGRKDLQVKVRGNKVEPAEIELALVGHTALKEAAVLCGEDPSGEPRLVAYCVAAKTPAPSVTELRGYLREKLPDYMQPSAFIMLDALPLTPNGKVDRVALSMPPPVRPELAKPFVPPQTPVQETLTAIWAEVLGLDRVGIHDDFLDLGGHSLMATRILSRVAEAFGVELSLQSLLQAPTVAQMAATISASQTKSASQEDLRRMLAELEALSEDEAQRLLSDKGARQP
ncbi:MAG: non-ribosomal peptide synthetase, partial [bacterium]